MSPLPQGMDTADLGEKMRRFSWSLSHSRDCHHPHPFNADLGDRAVMDFAEAVALANRRADRRRTRQRVSRHVGPVFRTGVYYIQDVR
jgi:hypothetical protein